MRKLLVICAGFFGCMGVFGAIACSGVSEQKHQAVLQKDSEVRFSSLERDVEMQIRKYAEKVFPGSWYHAYLSDKGLLVSVDTKVNIASNLLDWQVEAYQKKANWYIVSAILEGDDQPSFILVVQFEDKEYFTKVRLVESGKIFRSQLFDTFDGACDAKVLNYLFLSKDPASRIEKYLGTIRYNLPSARKAGYIGLGVITAGAMVSGVPSAVVAGQMALSSLNATAH